MRYFQPLVLMLAWVVALPGFAQEERGAIVGRMRNDNYRREAIVFERLVETDFSPQWWARFNDTSKNDQTSPYSVLRGQYRL